MMLPEEVTPMPVTDEEELCPAMLVEHATAETAADIADVLHELLSDEAVPETMRRDTRARIANLHRRFPMNRNAM